MMDRRPVYFELHRLALPAGAVASFLHRLSGVLLVLALPVLAEAFGRSLAGPAGFDEVEEVADLLKEEQPVVVNLSETVPEERRRIVDFLFGVIHAVDGDVCRVDDTVFIFTPNRISIDAPDAEVARRAMGSTIPLRSHPLRQQAM